MNSSNGSSMGATYPTPFGSGTASLPSGLFRPGQNGAFGVHTNITHSSSAVGTNGNGTGLPPNNFQATFQMSPTYMIQDPPYISIGGGHTFARSAQGGSAPPSIGRRRD